jgi:uncharacterized phage protein (TIGR02218 family)
MRDLPIDLTARTIKPARLCMIERKDGTILRIADSQSTITTTGSSPALTWTPIAGCEISAVKSMLGGDVPSMEIVASHSDGGTFDTDEIDKGLYDAANVDLYIVDRSNPTTLGFLFTGTIQPISYDISGRVIFDVRGQVVGAQTGYIQRFGPMCRTDLFSPLCGLSEGDWDHTGTVSAVINRFNFSVSGLSSPPADGWFNGGVIVTGDGVAFECANWDLSDLKVTSYLPHNRVISPGMSLTLYPGCDRRITTCHTKFDNAGNFQGEPHSVGIAAAVSGS